MKSWAHAGALACALAAPACGSDSALSVPVQPLDGGGADGPASTDGPVSTDGPPRIRCLERGEPPVDTAPGWDPSSPFEWVNPLPLGNPFKAVYARARNDVWVVGPAGTILHFDGGAWSRIASPWDAWLTGVWAADATHAWAVGHDDGVLPDQRGVILYWDGHTWTRQLSLGKDIGCVFGTAADDVWACQAEGPMLHFDGACWSVVEGGPVSGASSGVSPRRGVVHVAAGGVYDFDGTSWTEGELPLAARLTRIAEGGGELWASGPLGGLAHRSRGGAWEWERVPSFYGIWVFDRSLALGTGGSEIALWSGGRWQWLSEMTGFHESISGTSPDDVYFAGSNLTHYNRGKMQSQITGPTDDITAMWMAAPDDGWVAARGGGLRRFDGRSFVAVDSPRDVQALWGTARDNVWALAIRQIGHFDGASWRFEPTPAGESLTALSGSGRDNVWAAGFGGHVLRFDGARWTSVAGAGDHDVAAIAVIASDDVWLGTRWQVGIGAHAGLVHWDGRGFTAAAVPDPGYLTALWASGPSDVYAATIGDLLHFDGKSWSPLEATASAVWGSSRDDVWTLGGSQGTSHYDGKTWTRVETGANTAWGITGIARDRLWLYGINGSILRHR